MPEEPTGRPRRRGRPRARRSSGVPRRDGARSTSRSSRAPTSSRAPAPWWRRCIDVVDTGRDGYLFAKLDTRHDRGRGLSLYGAQHPIDVVVGTARGRAVVFVGPCCESGDILTPAPGDPEALGPALGAAARGSATSWSSSGAGAYCAAMSTVNYNSYPRAPRGRCWSGTARCACFGAGRSPTDVWVDESLAEASSDWRPLPAIVSDGVEPVHRRKARLKALTSSSREIGDLGQCEVGGPAGS